MRLKSLATALLLASTAACAAPDNTPAAPPASGKATAIFAGGCFWCIEADFEKLPGVIAAESGYTGGKEANPTYEQVSDHRTGHTEAVRLTYDPSKVSYSQLVEYFWRHIDPTVKDAQFCDRGPQYRSGIYPQDAAQMQVATASKAALVKSGRFPQVATEVLAATAFWPAEEYHQDYYKKNAIRYNYYRYGCGRDARVEALWGKK